MVKKNSRSSNSKKMEALARMQKISELLKLGGIQSQALLDSAGETRLSDESHVEDLLNSGSFGKGTETSVMAKKKSVRKKQKKTARKAAPKRKKGRK
jgi:hypothetical protein